jgi:cellulose synthase/poly-beta-1,6-N-acetylglucosamine synthase-like glycosyltransferase
MSDNNVSICILAHNEERHIQQSVQAVMAGLDPGPFNVFVYANGCTDQTIARVRDLADEYNNVYLRSLEVPSKPLAWNAAFGEHQSEFIIFSDGDVFPSPNAANTLVAALKTHPDAVIATSRQLPRRQDLNYQQKVVGFLQLPLLHEYLYGGFYAVRRHALAAIMAQKGFGGLPVGVLGEDCFLQFLLKPNQMVVADCNTYYEPPNFKDYFRYLARLRWQNEQLCSVYGLLSNDTRGCIRKLFHKIVACSGKRYLFLSIPAVILRIIFKKVFYKRINIIYRSLGPVKRDGANILNSLTRADSTK